MIPTTYRCPVCRARRASKTAACMACGWQPSVAGTKAAVIRPRTSWTRPALAVGGLLLVIIAGVSWAWHSRSVGAACTTDEDCNSYKCFKTSGAHGTPGSGAGVCTQFCDSNDDCPGDMACLEASRGNPRWDGKGAHILLVCAPAEEAALGLIDGVLETEVRR